MQLEDWLDDLCVRFIINLPLEELQSVERICFQVEEAQWFYEDFIRPLDPSLPSLTLRAFSLKIFQHCPLFSQWSAGLHLKAFEEFMAYKSRVPVRGAIMLNESMDEVVLVKGWKKAANWSFPRGKINKDENDLDCAIREVYEETGFDLREAGLVKGEKDMKYIEITMREQHMRLYVFPGISKDTHFEPRTRKEISKIEWYKLSDLPTIKKHRHQDSNGESHGLNANKFYMVAPFLHPLKKWIATQKKKNNRHSSNLAAPALLAEEVPTEDESNLSGVAPASQIPPTSAPTISSPSSQLKNMLSIGRPGPAEVSNPPSQIHVSGADAQKSNALLALLRGGPPAELHVNPHTPLEQQNFTASVPEPSQPQHRDFHNILPPIPKSQPQFYAPQNASGPLLAGPTPPFMRPIQNFDRSQYRSYSGEAAFQTTSKNTPQSIAPYQRTGDPQFAAIPNEHPSTVVPPASALPKLSTHAQSLLEVFKTTSPALKPQVLVSSGSLAHTLLASFGNGQSAQPYTSTARSGPLSPSQQPIGTGRTRASGSATQDLPPKTTTSQVTSPQTSTTNAAQDQPQIGQSSNLLNLFRQPSNSQPTSTTNKKAAHDYPVELAATAPEQKSTVKSVDPLLNFLQQSNVNTGKPPQKKFDYAGAVREGETSATVHGPLNQPHFEVATRGQQHPISTSRTPVGTHKTLYDPKQPAPMQILARPDTAQKSPAKSPRPAKAHTASQRHKKPEQTKEPPKPFQPQILKRPQTVSGQQESQVSPVMQPSKAEAVFDTSVSVKSASPVPEAVKSGRQITGGNHKQTLLSLFSGANTPKVHPINLPSGMVSPLSTSQMLTRPETSGSNIEPVSTRSRVGSITSATSGLSSTRPTTEKRQTTAKDRAFLLNYLGNMANQEG